MRLISGKLTRWEQLNKSEKKTPPKIEHSWYEQSTPEYTARGQSINHITRGEKKKKRTPWNKTRNVQISGVFTAKRRNKRLYIFFQSISNKKILSSCRNWPALDPDPHILPIPGGGFNQEYLHLQGWSKCLPTVGRELNNTYSATDLIFDKFWN